MWATPALLVSLSLLLIVVWSGASQPRGGILGERGGPGTQGAIASGSPAATRDPAHLSVPDPVAGPVAIVASSVPTWVDALGARHAEALFVVENRGTEAVEVDPAASRFVVHDSAGEVASGRLGAVVPPVLGPGERGYAFAAFSIPGPLPAAGTATATLRVRSPRPSLVELRVRDARVDASGPTLAIAGIARNDGPRRAVDGVVGAVLLDPAGEPLFAVLDAASAGVLEPRERRPFRAADPAIPAGVATADRVVAHGWAIAREERGLVARPAP
jgi:hypothetical protein